MRTNQVTLREALRATLRDWLRAALAVAMVGTMVGTLAACGGGDDNHSNDSSSSLLNGGSLPPSPTQQPDTVAAVNAVPITVGRGLGNVPNIPSVSVTICAPGAPTNCQKIDNIQLDTGSFGLRVVSSAINSTLLSALPVSTASTGGSLVQCATFADGSYTSGSVRTAFVSMGGQTTTTAIPIQTIGDSNASVVSGSCGGGSAENTVADLGTNGILGVGPALNDCGANCSTPALAAIYSNYFACASGSACTRATVPTASQVANPVANFPSGYNNGLIVQLPPVPNGGQASATGTLVFGIGTASNNANTAAHTFTTTSAGDLTNSRFNGATVNAYLDSGSNAYFFTDNSIALCGSNYPGFYCPSAAQTRTVTLVGANGASANASIGILSAEKLFGGASNFALNDLAGQIGTDFDLGLPFFYGRHVYYGFDFTATGGQSPYVAF